MSNQPFSVVAYGAWSFASAGSYIEVDDNCFQLKWQCSADGSYTAETPVGVWTLSVNSCNGRTVLSTGAKLNSPVRHLKYVMMECSDLPLEHLVYTGMKMGSCGIVTAPVAESQEFTCFYNCILSDKDGSLMLSHPLKQAQMAKFCGTVSGNSLTLSVVHLVDHYEENISIR